MTEKIVPLSEAESRVPDHGRIRMGEQKGGRPTKLEHWRLTSPDEKALAVLAGIYGGTVRRWSNPKANPKDQFELLTESKELSVVLPQGGLSTSYELWSGGGCLRRCDGEQCEIMDEDDWETVPCLCVQKGKMECAPYTRLNVIFPEVEFGGYWRLQSTGWNAMRELPSMEQVLNQIRRIGFIQAKLILEQRQSKGGRQKFVVPKLHIPHSVLEIIQGAADLPGLPSGQATSIEAPAPAALDPGRPFGRDAGEDEIIDAEIVDEVETAETIIARIKEQCTNIAADYGYMPDTIWGGLAHGVTKGRTLTLEAMTVDELVKVSRLATRIHMGELAPTGLEASGRLNLTKKEF